MGMFREFKDFAMRGNVIDMAIGVILGGSFGKIATSLVNDVVMPAVGMILGKIDFSNLVIILQEKTPEAEAIVIKYGLFINTIVDFTIVAFAIFLVIKQVNRFTQKPKPVLTAPTTKNCPKCISEISIKATRCPFCTSEI